MRYSTRSEYGLKAVVNLAAIYPGQKCLKNLADEEKISMKYLERIIGILSRAGIVKSFRGKEGGYKLAMSPSKIRIGEIVEALEGQIETMPCNSEKCLSIGNCPSSQVWIELEKQIRKTLYKIKLDSLIK